MGKALMAHAEELPPINFSPVTMSTITSVEAYRDDLAAVRKRGFSTDHEESIEGVSCVATAIRDGEGRAVAAIAVQGPTVRMTNERMTTIGQQLQESCADIREALGLAHPTLSD